MSRCPVCGAMVGGTDGLADHLVEWAERSDVEHVMWLNRNVTKLRTGAAELAEMLRDQGGQRPGQPRVSR